MIGKPRTSSFIWALLLLCSCTTAPHSPAISSKSDLPGEVSINTDAGCGNPIFVTLRLGSDEELPFELDTGAPYTLLDKSLVPRLGRRALSVDTSFFGGTKLSGSAFVAPPLHLGDTPLCSVWMDRLHTNVVITADLQGLASRLRHPMMGILGMDYLRYYCIQIDFQGARLRFLDPASLRVAGLGKRFALSYDAQGCPCLSHAALLGKNGGSAMIDIGYYTGDGALEPGLLQEARQQESGSEITAVEFRSIPQTCFSGCVWNGTSYTNLLLGEGANLIGLRFLARHLVTLDFLNDRMYLRPTMSGPPAGDWYLKFRAASESATAFISGLVEKGQLTGGGPTKGNWHWDWDELNPELFHFIKDDGSSVYHYNVAAAPQSTAWKLQRAWRTDQDGHTLEEYPVP